MTVLDALRRSASAAKSMAIHEEATRKLVIDADAELPDGGTALDSNAGMEKQSSCAIDVSGSPLPPLPPPKSPPYLDVACEDAAIASDKEAEEGMSVSQCSKRRRLRRVVHDEDAPSDVVPQPKDSAGDEGNDAPPLAGQHSDARQCMQSTDVAELLRLRMSKGKPLADSAIAGLAQGGNTCFLAAGLQIFFHTSVFAAWMKSRQCSCASKVCPSCMFCTTYNMATARKQAEP